MNTALLVPFLGTSAAFYVVAWIVLVGALYDQYKNKGRNYDRVDAIFFIMGTFLGPIVLLVFVPDLIFAILVAIKILLSRAE